MPEEKVRVNWYLVVLSSGKRYYTPTECFTRWRGIQLNDGRLTRIEDLYIKPDIKTEQAEVWIQKTHIVEVVKYVEKKK